MTRFSISNEADVRRHIQSLERQARFAGVVALNQTMFEVRRGVQDEMQKVFENPTRYVVNSVSVRKASKDEPRAEVYLRYPGGKGVDPESVLQAQVFGGRRRAKRAEVAFQRAGYLGKGEGMVPTSATPKDGYGNVPGSFIVQILSYFKAFGEQGYKANMTDKRRNSLAKFGKSERGFKTIKGAAYFISAGRDKTGHLRRGVYMKKGIHGSQIVPVFIFIPLPMYAPRLKFFDVARERAEREFGPRFQAQFAKAMNAR